MMTGRNTGSPLGFRVSTGIENLRNIKIWATLIRGFVKNGDWLLCWYDNCTGLSSIYRLYETGIIFSLKAIIQLKNEVGNSLLFML